MGVSQLGVDEQDRLVRSGLISSQIMGLAMMRYVWKIEPVASMTDDELVAAVAPNLQHYVEGDCRDSRGRAHVDCVRLAVRARKRAISA